jgi:hypothetical protein
MRLETLTAQKEQASRATAAIAWALASDRHLTADSIEGFGARGFGRYKAAVDPLTVADAAALQGFSPFGGAFVNEVDVLALPGRLPAALRMPIGADGAGRLLLGTVEAESPTELDAKAIATIDFALSGTPQKAQATIVLSAEAARATDGQIQAGIRQHLVAAVARRVDALIVTALTAGASAGSTDPGALIAAISGGQPQSPVIIAGWDTIQSWDAGTVRDLQALGIAVVPCGAAAGKAIAVDQSGLLLADAGAVVETARHASIALSDGPGDDAPVTSLFQRNLIALRAERWMSVSVRASAVAYGNLGSPA